MKDESEVRVTSETGGQKGQKEARYDLLPAVPLRTVAELFGKGAQKYEERNWERGYEWSLSFAALNRHLWQFWNGEDIDEELGKPHLAAVIFHALALLEFSTTHPEFDNRPNSKVKSRINVADKLGPVGRAAGGSVNIPNSVPAATNRQGVEAFRFCGNV